MLKKYTIVRIDFSKTAAMSDQLNRILENINENAGHDIGPAEVVKMSAVSDEVIFLVAQNVQRP